MDTVGLDLLVTNSFLFLSVIVEQLPCSLLRLIFQNGLGITSAKEMMAEVLSRSPQVK